MVRPGPSTSRRAFLAAAGAAALPVTSASATAGSHDDAAGWSATYTAEGEQWFTAATPAHGGGWVAAGRDDGGEYSPSRGWLVAVDPEGRERWRRRYDDVSGTLTDVRRTEAGYVATGEDGHVVWLDREGRRRSAADVHEDDPLRRTRLVPAGDGHVLGGVAPTPESASTVIVGLEADGSVRWRRRYATDYSLAFLQPWGDGVVAGGWYLREGGPWLAGLAPDGTEQWLDIRSLPDWQTPAGAVRADEGLTLLGEGGLLHLDADRSVAWRRRLTALDGSHLQALDRLADGSYLVAGIDEETDLVRLASLDPDRRLRWTGPHGAAPEGVDPGYRVTDLIALSSDDALLVGTRRKGRRSAWAARLGPADLDTPTVTSSPTATADQGRTPSTGGPTPTVVDTGQPGFGILATLAGLAGAGLWRTARDR